MLGDSEIYPTIAVNDMDASKRFYGTTLGLKVTVEMDSMVLYEAGPGKLLVYESEYAGTNEATYANWDVDNIEDIVKRLQAAGVAFEEYDELPNAPEGVTRDGVIHKSGNMQSAWFRDPTGNILALTSLGQ